MAKVVISGYYGFGNTGDEAILAAVIQALRSQNQRIELVVLSANPVQTAADYQVKSVSRTSLSQIAAELKNAQLFISGGGGLLQDVTSSRTIPYYLTLVYLAKLLGVPTAFYAQGIGPIKGNFGKFLTSWVGKQVDLITLRDEKSLKELLELGIDSQKVVVTADPVLGLSPEGNGEELLEKEGVDLNWRPIVGISLRPWPGEYQQAVIEAADYMAKEWQAQIVFLPFHLPGDWEVSQEAAKRMKSPSVVLSGKYLPPHYLALLGQVDLLLGMRLHSLIFAARMGVPLVGISYDPKIDRFLEGAGGHPVLPVETLSFAKLKPLLDSTWHNRKEIRVNLKEKAAFLEDKALENARLVCKLLESGCR